MKNKNIETKIGALTNERTVLRSFARDSETTSAFTLAVLKEPSLREFVTRNFQDEIEKLEKWVNEVAEKYLVAKTSGTLTVEIDKLEYSLLDKNKLVGDIDWEDVANQYVEKGYGYSEFNHDEEDLEIYTSLYLDMAKVENLQEVA